MNCYLIIETLTLCFVLGGDPTGTGKSGVPIYGECLYDDVHDDVKHTGKFTSLRCNIRDILLY